MREIKALEAELKRSRDELEKSHVDVSLYLSSTFEHFYVIE